jgi:hypothetical protein
VVGEKVVLVVVVVVLVWLRRALEAAVNALMMTSVDPEYMSDPI